MARLLLGLRLAWGAARTSPARCVLQASGAAVAVVTLVVTVGLVQGNASRETRQQAQSPRVSPGGQPAFRARIGVLPYAGRPWRTVLLTGGQATPPPPPGLTSFPAPGSVWVSPEVRRRALKDEAVADRLPGPVTGVIGRDGLDSPDQLLTYVGVGAAPPGAFAAAGWGGAADAVLVPRTGLLLTVGVLVGVPLAVFVALLARSAARARRRRLAALHLLGVSTDALVASVGTEIGVLTAAGAGVGVVIGSALLELLADRGALGVSWFAADTRPSSLAVVVVVAAVAVGMSWIARRDVRRTLDSPLAARRDAPAAPTGRAAWAALPGAAFLLAVVATGVVQPNRALATPAVTLAMVVTDCAVVAGVVSLLGRLARVAGERLRARAAGPATLLASARLAFDAGPTARLAAGIVLAVVSSLVGAAVVDDLASLAAPGPAGHTLTVPLASSRADGGTRAAVSEAGGDAAGVVVPLPSATASTEVGPASSAPTLLVASCAQLAHLTGARTTSGGAPCAPGRTYAVAGMSYDRPLRDPDGKVLPAPAGTLRLGGAAALLGQPVRVSTQPLRRWAVAASGASLVLRPGSDGAAEAVVSRLLRLDPTLDVVYNDLDAQSTYQYPVIRRVVFVCLGLGVTVGLAGFLVGAVERYADRWRESAQLAVVGASRAVLARAAVGQSAVGVGLALLTGAAAGWLIGAAYLTLGGHHGLFLDGFWVALLVSAAVMTATLMISIALVGRRLPSEHLRRE